MFGISKDRLIQSLKNGKGGQCSYGIKFDDIANTYHCDCKYGVDEGGFSRSEKGCGCPELSQVIYMLINMTDEEFSTICNRSKITQGCW